MTHLRVRPWETRGRPGSVRRVTWLWTLLIVVGIAMIVVAVWPSIRGKTGKPEDKTGKPEDEKKSEGV
jgi:hypothetical protein